MLAVDNPDPAVQFPHLRGLRVFLVEDEPMISLLFEDMLAELGCEVVASASKFSQARELAERTEHIDVAILDVLLGDQPVFPLARQLTERGVSVLFCTGLGAEGLPAEWQACRTLGKPITIEGLAKGLSRTAAAD